MMAAVKLLAVVGVFIACELLALAVVYCACRILAAAGLNEWVFGFWVVSVPFGLLAAVAFAARFATRLR
jgi:hypothetical protein